MSCSRYFSFIRHLIALGCVLLLSACGGGGGNTPGNNLAGPPSSGDPSGMTMELLHGTAAKGAALSGLVTVVDTAGTAVTGPIMDGHYELTVTGMQRPLLLRVQTATSETFYSYVVDGMHAMAGTHHVMVANITQLSTLALQMAAGGTDLNVLFSEWPLRHAEITLAALIDAQAKINASYAGMFSTHGLESATYNFFTAYFLPNGLGFDAVLDAAPAPVAVNGIDTSAIDKVELARQARIAYYWLEETLSCLYLRDPALWAQEPRLGEVDIDPCANPGNATFKSSVTIRVELPPVIDVPIIVMPPAPGVISVDCPAGDTSPACQHNASIINSGALNATAGLTAVMQEDSGTLSTPGIGNFENFAITMTCTADSCP